MWARNSSDEDNDPLERNAPSGFGYSLQVHCIMDFPINVFNQAIHRNSPTSRNQNALRWLPRDILRLHLDLFEVGNLHG